MIIQISFNYSQTKKNHKMNLKIIHLVYVTVKKNIRIKNVKIKENNTYNY